MEEEYLVHWLGKGKASANHKYISREWKNGRWYYVYSKAKKSGEFNRKYNNAERNLKNTYNSWEAAKSKNINRTLKNYSGVHVFDKNLPAIINKTKYQNHRDTINANKKASNQNKVRTAVSNTLGKAAVTVSAAVKATSVVAKEKIESAFKKVQNVTVSASTEVKSATMSKINSIVEGLRK